MATMILLSGQRIGLVVDDDTASIGCNHPESRCELLQRTPLRAGQAKGEALNAAVQCLRTSHAVRDADHDEAAACVMDVDGRLDADASDDVMSLYADPDLGAVRIEARISKRHQSVLARMQGVDFLLYTHVVQRGRCGPGSVGLSGNGRIVGPTAPYGVGVSPWSRRLTEDPDVGVRLLLGGRSTELRSTSSVHRQERVDVGRWVRQPTRGFQGRLQLWALLPWVLRDLTGSSRTDLLPHLTSHHLLLLATFLSAGSGLWIADLSIGPAIGAVVSLIPLYVLYEVFGYVAGRKASA